ncbi:hypothetical protein ACFL37_01995 [Candidatus Margulisiibacteriota bacterium]
MKKFRLLTLAGLLLWALGTGAYAQAGLYSGIYWVDGSILPPPGAPTVTTDGRMVVFYQVSPEAGYAMDVSGTAGLSGRSGEFMLNAMEDWRLSLAPGTYQIAVVNGDDNYGADPVAFTISGNGYDTAPALILAEGAGIQSPEARALPPGLAAEVPVIEKIWFDDTLYQKGLVARGKQAVVTDTPKISVRVTAGNLGIDLNTLAIELDAGSANEEVFTVTASHITTQINSAIGLPIQIDYTFDFAVEGQVLIEDDHTLTFTASNTMGTSSEVASVSVIGGPARIIGTPLTYPSPLHLSQQNSVILQYGLSKDTNIDLYIFDLTGQVVKKISCNAGTEGGSAGGDANPNKVAWNLIADQGTSIGSGIYIWNIVDRDSNKLLGKGKLAAAP